MSPVMLVALMGVIVKVYILPMYPEAGSDE